MVCRRVGNWQLCKAEFEAFDQILAGDVCEVLVDLQELTFIDSTGIGCLLHGAMKAEKMNISFEIVPSAAVRRFVDAAGLSQYLRGVDQGRHSASDDLGRGVFASDG